MGSNYLTTETSKIDYVDENGLQQRVLLPAGVHAVREGIPISLDVDSLFAHAPIEYRRRLNAELWARGLVEPCDYLKAGAGELIRASIISAIKTDLLDVITLAKKECK